MIWFEQQQYQEDETGVTPPSYTLYGFNTTASLELEYESKQVLSQ